LNHQDMLANYGPVRVTRKMNYVMKTHSFGGC
jgi:hypothetical protein